MTLYSFVWLKENQWNFGWNFQVCTMNFKWARKKIILNTNMRKRFSKSFTKPTNFHPI